MNGLKALRHIKEDNFPVMIATYPPMPATFEGYTKDELFLIVEKELKDGEKHKKAFDIIKEKKVNLEYLKCCETYEQYKTICSYWNELTQEEFNFLKEVMK